MEILFLTLGFLFFFYLGYKHGRRVEKWAKNHPPKEGKEVTKDGVKSFLDNLNKN